MRKTGSIARFGLQWYYGFIMTRSMCECGRAAYGTDRYARHCRLGTTVMCVCMTDSPGRCVSVLAYIVTAR